MAENTKEITKSIKDKALGNDNAGSSNPVDERAESQRSTAKAEDTDSSASSTVKVELNPVLIGYGYDKAALPSGDEVAAGKAKEISQEDFDNAGKTSGGFDILVRSNA